MHDVESDLNAPRPIVAGGTGATSARGALIALGGEIADQLVTNYDTFQFLSGSFQSNPGTTGEPVAGHTFVGTVVVHDPSNMVLEARDLLGAVPSPIYVRQKSGGTWYPWTINDPTAKVSKVGDSMSGNLTLSNGTALSPRIVLLSPTFKDWQLDNASGAFRLTDPTSGNPGLTMAINGDTRVYSTTASTSYTTGALTVAGGLGIAGRITAGGNPISPTTVVEAIGYLGGSSQYGTSFRPVTDNTTPIIFNNAAGTAVGTINTTAAATTYVTSSDGRLKEDLRPLDAGPVIDAIRVYDFAWRSTGERSSGVVAQEAAEIYPQAVTYDEQNDWYGTDYSRFVPLLLAELKALRARVAELERNTAKD